jgi:hypothetical protein
MTSLKKNVCTFAVPLAVSLAFLGGCGDDDDDEKDHDSGEEEQELDPICDEIREACHDADEGTGKPFECHEIAHENDVDACEAERDSCLEACSGEHSEH